MKKDSEYYENRIKQNCGRRYDEIAAILIEKGMTADDIYQLELEDDHRLSDCDPNRFYYRLNVNFPEVTAILQKLFEIQLNSESEKVYEIHWEGRGKGSLSTKFTQQEMFDRLRWISGDDFGDDMREWAEWYAAWKAEPPVPII